MRAKKRNFGTWNPIWAEEKARSPTILKSFSFIFVSKNEETSMRTSPSELSLDD